MWGYFDNFFYSIIHSFCFCMPYDKWVFYFFLCRKLYCFSLQSGKLEHLMKVCMIPQMKTFVLYWFYRKPWHSWLGFLQVHEKDVIGIAHHPHRNLVATYAVDCMMKIWKAWLCSFILFWSCSFYGIYYPAMFQVLVKRMYLIL
jgi:hypothetical protein